MSYQTEQTLQEKIAVSVDDNAGYLRVQKLKQGLVQRTDTTNAERIVKQYGDVIRYNRELKKWIVWNGSYWEIDLEDAEIHTRGLAAIRSIHDDALKTDDYKERMEIEKFGIKSEAWGRRTAAITAASKMPEVKIEYDEFDANPWLLNVKNGTVNVVTGEFKEHDKGDYIMRVADAAYDAVADCPTWKKFIREIMNHNVDLITFLQTAAGWALTGDTSEQTMFILFGSGANGKSTFLNTIINLLGDYAANTQTETFLKQNTEKINNDIARLRGMRFVVTSETEQGKLLSEPLVKQITGNDKLTARFLFSEFFSFYPSFKFFIF